MPRRGPRYSRTTNESRDTLSAAHVRAQFAMYLACARSLDGVTVDDLCRRYRLPRGFIAEKFEHELNRRSRML